MQPSRERYGVTWPANFNPLMVEMACIQKGGTWINRAGKNCGQGLIHHYEQMRQILWPELDDHRWHRLIRDTILTEKCTVLAGPASSGKTHEASWIFVCEYFCFPEETCILVSSTDMRGLRGRIWSEITMLWKKAKDKFPELPGNLLDSRVSILTDSLGEAEFDVVARDYRKCIQGVPCREHGSWLGINRYAGWKQKRMRLLADEAAQMEAEFISGITNLNSNPDFKCVIMGNFADPMDCLGRCAEPADGWSNHMDPMKTSVWDTFFPLKGKCVNLIGFDSPNYDIPKLTPNEKDHYRYMIGPRKIAEIKASFGETSIEFYSQCWGAMKVSTLSFRVLTRELCEQGHAFDEAVWQGAALTRIGALDSAWGGDRAVFTWGEFGPGLDGKTLLRLSMPDIIPIDPKPGKEADECIAEWIKDRCETLGIPPENFFHDSTGRGSLGTFLSRVWSDQCNPVEFGGPPTNRPVSQDYYWTSSKEKQRRLKLCNEHYSKFVTELWFSVHYCVQSGQLRNLAPEVMEEFGLRVWKRVKEDKIEIEPKTGTREKPGMKQRTGRSPDLADSAAIVVEGARRRGFQISKLANEETESSNLEWLEELAKRNRRLVHRADLSYKC